MFGRAGKILIGVLFSFLLLIPFLRATVTFVIFMKKGKSELAFALLLKKMYSVRKLVLSFSISASNYHHGLLSFCLSF